FFSVLGAVDRFDPVSDAGIELVNTDTMVPKFAIGESVGYTSTSINTNGILDAGTYKLIAFADTVHQHFGGGSDPTTAGAEFELSFTLAAVGLTGDYNSNGVVDAADYVLWRKNPGNFPADAYATWRSHFGQPSGSGSGAATNTTVPEPATLLMMMFAATGWCLRRGRAG
ncbi:MAG: PEP-CTERM sorting domain-containing protein, partial [Pirellulales bacterium]|nr:PEP-CTERM sorting domain-containing protein [Pirellulales bacterium]